ncbi:trypsin-like serine peptidase [Halobacteriovorax sp. GFR7]|uniref:trypsin-like serine peptidase n=1 Tax=unclassified Halobacteriovorax TaxID=2639665 RepID=UPI003D98282C
MRIILSLCFLTIFLSCHNQDAELLIKSNKMIYGDDNRREVSKNIVSDATAAIIHKDNLERFVSIKERSNLCPDERFAHQNSIGECSSFLISENKMMTAGHCVFLNKGDQYNFCDNFVFVFDYTQENSTYKKVYECEKVTHVLFDVEEEADVAIIALKESVSHTRPLKLSTDFQEEEKLITVGSPLGAPLKIVDQGKVEYDNGPTLEYNLDVFGGNSGSAIYSLDQNAVIGVHTFGSGWSLVKDTANNCMRYNRCPQDSQDPLCMSKGGFAGGMPIREMPAYFLNDLN